MLCPADACIGGMCFFAGAGLCDMQIRHALKNPP